MQRNWMVVIFLGGTVALFGAYMLVNQEGGKQEGAKGSNTPSLDGSFATIDSDTIGTNSAWVDLVGSSDDKGNMTKNVARAAFEQMRALDQQGKSPFDEENTNTAEVRESMERSVAESTNALFDGISVNTKDLRITTNNTKEAKKRYLKDLEATLARYPVNEAYRSVEGGLQGLVERSCEGGDVGASGEISLQYNEIAKAVALLQVPSRWVDFQKEMIMHYRQGGVIFDAVKKCYDDPLRGFSAAQSLSLFVSDSTILQKSLEKMYTEIE